MSQPEGSHWSHGRVASVVHTTDESGKDDLIVEPRRSYTTKSGYSKAFTSLEELLDWAQKKNFTTAHIESFLARYEEKKAQAKQDAEDEEGDA